MTKERFKGRRNHRRLSVKATVELAFQDLIRSLGLRRVKSRRDSVIKEWKNQEAPFDAKPTVSSSAELSNLLKLERRLQPLFACAHRELSLRRKNVEHQRRRERSRTMGEKYRQKLAAIITEEK